MDEAAGNPFGSGCLLRQGEESKGSRRKKVARRQFDWRSKVAASLWTAYVIVFFLDLGQRRSGTSQPAEMAQD